MICRTCKLVKTPQTKQYFIPNRSGHCRGCYMAIYHHSGQIGERRISRRKTSNYTPETIRYCIDCRIKMKSTRRRCMECRLINMDKKHLKKITHSLVRQAIVQGHLIRPDKCSICDSNIRVEGHHPDYSKPLKVEWLCRRCHVDEHLKLNSYSVFTGSPIQATH